jgi:hypothetical protein
MESTDPPQAPASAEPHPPPQSSPPVQWYHLDPATSYQELRTGVSPGIARAVMVGLAIAVVAIGLMYVAAWMNQTPVTSAAPAATQPTSAG